MLKDIIILLLVAYVVSRILRVLVPVFRISSAASSQMRDMQEQMNARMKEMEEQVKRNNNTQKKKVERDGDYIDYEEVK